MSGIFVFLIDIVNKTYIFRYLILNKICALEFMLTGILSFVTTLFVVGEFVVIDT